MLTIDGMNFEVLFTEEQIRDRVAEVAQQMQADFKDRVDSVIFLTVLDGSMRFSADLMRHIDFPIIADSVKLQSYEGEESTGEVKSLTGLKHSIEGKDVIIVEDIIDTGNTYHELLAILRKLNPKSIQMCTLLYKPDKYEYDYPLDYIGFEIGNDFVVGYGLDYDGKYRQLNPIYRRVG